MKELYRTNDPVALSWLTAMLIDTGIDAWIMDTHTSIAEGSIGAIQKRLMVEDQNFEKAKQILNEAGFKPTNI